MRSETCFVWLCIVPSSTNGMWQSLTDRCAGRLLGQWPFTISVLVAWARETRQTLAGSRRWVDGDLGCKLAGSRPCSRAAGEMKRACLGGQNAQRSKDGLRCLFFITRSLLRSTARVGKGRTGRCGETRLPSRPRSPCCSVLRDSLSVRVAGSVRTTHDPGSWGQRAYLPRNLPIVETVAAWRARMVLWLPRALIPFSCLSGFAALADGRNN